MWEDLGGRLGVDSRILIGAGCPVCFMDFRNPEIQRYVLAWSRKTLTIEKGLRKSVCVYTNLKTSQNL